MKEVLRAIEAIARCSEEISSVEFKHLKLSRGLHLYLTFVCENPGEPAGLIPDRLKVKRAAAARALRKLEDDGLVIQREAPDLRKDKRVYPTEQGKSAYLFIRDEGEYSDLSSLRGLSPEEAAQLLDLLYRVRINVEKDWRFVQKGGRRPYIHEYYDRLVAAAVHEEEDSVEHGVRSAAEQSAADRSPGNLHDAADLAPDPNPDLDSETLPYGQNQDGSEVSLWTYEETKEQDAKRLRDSE